MGKQNLLFHFFQHFNNFSILMVGRLLGGIATSILYSAFESWVIYEHHKVHCSLYLSTITISYLIRIIYLCICFCLVYNCLLTL